jgi:predicted DsbA family dithiol-disulfide isomerase
MVADGFSFLTFSLTCVLCIGLSVLAAQNMVVCTPMSHPGARFYFDFVDPLSYLLELELRAIEPVVPIRVERVGFELVPPPGPLSALENPRWAARWTDARPLAEAAGVRLGPPRLVPWTRKAHELHLLAREHGKADEARLAIFTAYFQHGDDIGRVDRLVAIASACGLDAAATRTVLGVDHHEEDVVAVRNAAAAAGVTDVPAILVHGGLVRGFHNRADLGTLLGP